MAKERDTSPSKESGSCGSGDVGGWPCKDQSYGGLTQCRLIMTSQREAEGRWDAPT